MTRVALLAAVFFVGVYVLLYGAARFTHLLVYAQDICGPSGVVATRHLSDDAQRAVDLVFLPPRVLETETRDCCPYFWTAIRSRMPGR